MAGWGRRVSPCGSRPSRGLRFSAGGQKWRVREVEREEMDEKGRFRSASHGRLSGLRGCFTHACLFAGPRFFLVWAVKRLKGRKKRSLNRSGGGAPVPAKVLLFRLGVSACLGPGGQTAGEGRGSCREPHTVWWGGVCTGELGQGFQGEGDNDMYLFST